MLLLGVLPEVSAVFSWCPSSSPSSDSHQGGLELELLRPVSCPPWLHSAPRPSSLHSRGVGVDFLWFLA